MNFFSHDFTYKERRDKTERKKNISINEYRYPRFGQRENCIRFDPNERNHLYMCVSVRTTCFGRYVFVWDM